MTRASGPSRTSRRSSQAGSLTASTTSSVPSGRVVVDSAGYASATHAALGRQLERDPGVVGARAEHLGDLVVAGRRLEVLAGRAQRADAVDAEHALVVRPGGSTRSTYHSPIAKNATVGIDAARRQLVAAGRPVVDLDALAARRGVADGVEVRRLPDLDRELREVERVLELRERGRERAVGIAARHGEQRAARRRAARDLRPA